GDRLGVDRRGVGERVGVSGAEDVVAVGSLAAGPLDGHAGRVGRRGDVGGSGRSGHLVGVGVDLHVGELGVLAAHLVDRQGAVLDLDGADGLVELAGRGADEPVEDRRALGAHQVRAVVVGAVTDGGDHGVAAVGQVVLPDTLLDGAVGNVH